MTESFDMGRLQAQMENVTRDIAEIKEEMKEHNKSDKEQFQKLHEEFDTANKLSEKNAKYHAIQSQKIDEIHEFMKNVAENQEKMDKKIGRLQVRATYGVGFAAGVSSVITFISIWFKDKIIAALFR